MEDFNSETFISEWSPFRLELPLNKKSLYSALQCQGFRYWLNKKFKKKAMQLSENLLWFSSLFPAGSGGSTTEGNTFLIILHTRNWVIIYTVHGIFHAPLFLKCIPPSFCSFWNWICFNCQCFLFSSTYDGMSYTLMVPQIWWNVIIGGGASLVAQH